MGTFALFPDLGSTEGQRAETIATVESNLIAGNGTYAHEIFPPADPVFHIDGSKFLIQQLDGEKVRLHIDNHTQLHTDIDRADRIEAK